MLKLPFLFRESYRERLITLKLMPLCYWHEYLDLVLFYKAVTGQVGLYQAYYRNKLSTNAQGPAVTVLSFVFQDAKPYRINVRFSLV